MRRERQGRFASLFWRLMLAFGSVVLTTLLLSSLILNVVVERFFQRQLASAMLEDARGVALWAEPYMLKAPLPGELRSHLPWLRELTAGRLWVIDPDRIVIADTDTANTYRGKRVDHAWIGRVLDGETLTETRADPWLGSAITVGQPIASGGRVIGAVFVFVPPTRIWELFSEFRFLIGLSVVGVASIGLAAAYTFSRSFSRPIVTMVRFAQGLGQQRFAGELEPSPVRELDHLGTALEKAGHQLQAAFTALAEEKQRLQSLMEDMAEGVVAVDYQGRLLLVNPAAGRLLGQPGPFEGLSLDGAGFPAELTRALLRVAAPGTAPDGQSVLFACGGVELQAHVSPVLSAAGAPSGAVALLQNVTSELQLRRLRENFVANVSHELRAPLAALSAGVEAMHDGLIPQDSRPRYLKAMLSEIGRLRRLVDDLLELSRLDAGMLEIPQEEFDLQPLCEGLAEKWEPRCSAAGIRLEVDCPRLRVVANYDRVEQILANFLDNAVRYTPQDGTIRLFARPDGEMVRVGVQDTGAGIAAEHLGHIWDRFYKVDQARTRTRTGGTGLGLAIVKQLVERLGGEVAVESLPGEGSTFSFTLVGAVRGAN